MHTNIEIKAYTKHPNFIRFLLNNRNAEYRGLDHQIDTYFNCIRGRLKLREGNIENALIYYRREDKAGPKQSLVNLREPYPGMKDILTEKLGVLTVVDKEREIYFIGNVKFHLDQVEGLGNFVEIEAIDKDGTIGKKKLLAQCRKYLKLFVIQKEDLITESYSDLLIEKQAYEKRLAEIKASSSS